MTAAHGVSRRSSPTAAAPERLFPPFVAGGCSAAAKAKKAKPNTKKVDGSGKFEELTTGVSAGAVKKDK